MQTSMKITYVIVIMLILMSPCMNASSPKSWTLVDSGSGINLYERWVFPDNGIKVKERKGEMTVNSDIREVLLVLKDPSKTKLWMSNVTNAYLIRKISEQAWYSYTYFSLPWPFANRDMVSFSTLSYSCEGSSACIEMTSRETAIAVKPEATRMNNFKAIWELREVAWKKTQVSFSAISYSPAEYPRFIQDRVMKGTFMTNLQKLKNLLEK